MQSGFARRTCHSTLLDMSISPSGCPSSAQQDTLPDPLAAPHKLHLVSMPAATIRHQLQTRRSEPTVAGSQSSAAFLAGVCSPSTAILALGSTNHLAESPAFASVRPPSVAR